MSELASFCTAHLERTGEQVPAHSLGLCLSCFQGNPVARRIEVLGSNYGNNPSREPRRNASARARHARRRARAKITGAGAGSEHSERASDISKRLKGNSA